MQNPKRFASVDHVAETGSTNTDLIAAARSGGPEQFLFAAHQLAGRGRRNRVWTAPPGSSLMGSVLVRPRPQDHPPHLCMAALALAAIDACRQIAGIEPAIKWPNDLVVDDRKLAGMLAESVVDNGRVSALVIGIGLNVNWPPSFPAEIAATATSLNHLRGDGTNVSIPDLAAALTDRFAYRMTQTRSSLEADHLARSATIGRSVRIELHEGELTGLATGISPEGALIVDTGGATSEVVVGDVVHLRPGDATPGK